MRFWGLKNCDTCRRAAATLAAAGYELERIDVRADGVAPVKRKAGAMPICASAASTSSDAITWPVPVSPDHRALASAAKSSWLSARLGVALGRMPMTVAPSKLQSLT